MPTIGEITAYWTSAEVEGSCTNRFARSGKVALIRFGNDTVRMCADCLDSLWAMSESLLDEAAED